MLTPLLAAAEQAESTDVAFLKAPFLAREILKYTAGWECSGRNLRKEQWGQPAVEEARIFQFAVLGTTSVLLCALVLFALEVVVTIVRAPHIAVVEFGLWHGLLLYVMLPAVSTDNCSLFVLYFIYGGMVLLLLHWVNSKLLSQGLAELCNHVDTVIFLSLSVAGVFAMQAKSTAASIFTLLRESPAILIEAPIDLEKQEECAICCQPIGGSSDDTATDQVKVTTICKHSFHRDCIQKWIERSRHCPLCRTQMDSSPHDDGMTTEDLQGNKMVRCFLAPFVSSHSAEVWTRLCIALIVATILLLGLVRGLLSHDGH